MSLGQLLTTCKDFFAVSEHFVQEDGLLAQPGLVPPSLDSLSIGLRELSTRLVLLVLRGGIVISPALFWPHGDECCATEPYWPNLEWIDVTYPPVDAAGEKRDWEMEQTLIY